MNVMNKKIDEASDNRQPTWSVGSIGVIQIYSIAVLNKICNLRKWNCLESRYSADNVNIFCDKAVLNFFYYWFQM